MFHGGSGCLGSVIAAFNGVLGSSQEVSGFWWVLIVLAGDPAVSRMVRRVAGACRHPRVSCHVHVHVDIRVCFEPY